MISPGPFAPQVTQHKSDTPTEDAYGNEVPAFTSRVIRVLAEYPTAALESDNPGGDVITADRTLLVPDSVTVSELDEFTISDGLRYRVDGAPAVYRHPTTGTSMTRVNLRRIT